MAADELGACCDVCAGLQIDSPAGLGAGPGQLSVPSVSCSELFLYGALYGRAGRLTLKNGGFSARAVKLYQLHCPGSGLLPAPAGLAALGFPPGRGKVRQLTRL